MKGFPHVFALLYASSHRPPFLLKRDWFVPWIAFQSRHLPLLNNNCMSMQWMVIPRKTFTVHACSNPSQSLWESRTLLLGKLLPKCSPDRILDRSSPTSKISSLYLSLARAISSWTQVALWNSSDMEMKFPPNDLRIGASLSLNLQAKWHSTSC